MIRAVLFDLDDTLFPQSSWLDGAWQEVCRAAAPYGVDAAVLRPALVAVAAEGTARGGIIDRALAEVGAAGVPTAPLVAAFRRHRPRSLQPYAGARAAVAGVRARLPVGLVTDGDVGVQESKLRALGLEASFDVVVCSDVWGREFRKPHERPFLAALDALGVGPEDAVFVGDHPHKDVAGTARIGMRCVRVRTGEYREVPASVPPWREVPDVVAACAVVLAAAGEMTSPGPLPG